MAGFTSIALLSLTAASAGVSAYGQYKAGKSQAKAYEAQGEAEREAGAAAARSKESEAQLAEYNAAVAELQAADATTRGALEANRFRKQVAQVIGSQRTGFAAGNVDVGYGSAVDVQGDAAFLGELDALTIRTNAAREAWGYKVEAEDLKQRAAISRQEGEFARESGVLAAQTGREAGKAAKSVANWGAAGTVVSAGASLLQAKYGWGRR